MAVRFPKMSHGAQKPGAIGWMSTVTEKMVRGTSVVTAFVAADYRSGCRDGAVPTAKIDLALMAVTFSSFGMAEDLKSS
jgi:hypothetical protein